MYSRLMWWKTSTGTMPRPRRPTTTRPDDGWNDQNGYVSGEEDILGYYFQPVEIDARAYAAEETERLQGLIDKELQKET